MPGATMAHLRHMIGIITITGVLSSAHESINYPSTFSINRIFPNPFNPITKISFSVPFNSENLSLRIFDILGSMQAELANGTFEAGNYTVNWQASNKSSGIYFIELKAKQFRDIKKVTLIK